VSETESRGHLNVEVGAGPYLRSKQPWGRIGWGHQGTSPLPAAQRLIRRGAKVANLFVHPPSLLTPIRKKYQITYEPALHDTTVAHILIVPLQPYKR